MLTKYWGPHSDLTGTMCLTISACSAKSTDYFQLQLQ